MSKQQDFLSRAAVELGLRFELNREIQLTDGRSLNAWIFFPDLSSPTGIHVIEWSRPTSEVQTRLPHGLNASFISEAGSGEDFDLDNYVQMFAEWGWSGTGLSPDWMATDTS